MYALFMTHHSDTWVNKKKMSFYISLSSQHGYLCVGVNSCQHLRHMLLFFFFFFLCHCVIVCIHYREYVSVGLHACVLTPVVREEGGIGRKKSALSEMWNALSFGITLAHVHWKTQRGVSAAKHMRG